MDSAAGASVVQEGVLQKRGRVSSSHRYVKLVADLRSHVSDPRLSSELLIYFNQKQDKLKKRMKIEEIVNVFARDHCAFHILFNDGKTLEFKAETNEAYLCWVSNLKAALGRGEVFHVQLFSSAGMEHALMYSMEVALPTHRLGQIDRILVLTSPVHEINLYAWDLNRILTFTKSDIGIRMELCRTCAGSKDTITFLVPRPYLNSCMEFLCREARITYSPTDERGAWVYRADHKCGFSNAPTIPAPTPPGAPEVTHFLTQCSPASYAVSCHERFEGPYSVSKRLIVTDSGIVKFESKIFGSCKPMAQAERQGNVVTTTGAHVVPSPIKPTSTPTSGLRDPCSSSLPLISPSEQASTHAHASSPHPLSPKMNLISHQRAGAPIEEVCRNRMASVRKREGMILDCSSANNRFAPHFTGHEIMHSSNQDRFCESKQQVFAADALASGPKALTVSKVETTVPKPEALFGTFTDEAFASKLTISNISTSKSISGANKRKPIPAPRSSKHRATDQNVCSVSVSVTSTVEAVIRDD